MHFLNKINTISNKVFTLLLGLVLTGSLINSKLFIYPSLTAYFLFAILISGLAIVSGVILVVRFREQGFSLTFPAFIFLTLIAYSSLHGLFLHGYLNFRHIYLLLCGLFFLSAICIFRIKGFNHKTLFIIIGLLGVIESVWCLLQFIGLIDSANTYFRVSGSWVNPNVTAMFLAMCLPVLLALWLIYTGVFRKVITVSFIFMLVALMLLNCRTAYIGAGTAIILILNYRFGITDWLKTKKNRLQSLFIIIFNLLILIPAGIKLYESKKESADGRLLIWKISTGMIFQKTFTGYGYGMF
jgi:O-antigen ligase